MISTTDIDINTLAKKLKGSWSSHTVAQLNVRGSSPILASLEEIIKVYDKFSSSPNPDDKRVLTRMITSLLSIVGVDYSQRSTHIPLIKKLLERAASDKDEVIHFFSLI
jgi:hypothetical protein